VAPLLGQPVMLCFFDESRRGRTKFFGSYGHKAAQIALAKSGRSESGNIWGRACTS